MCSVDRALGVVGDDRHLSRKGARQLTGDVRGATAGALEGPRRGRRVEILEGGQVRVQGRRPEGPPRRVDELEMMGT